MHQNRITEPWRVWPLALCKDLRLTRTAERKHAPGLAGSKHKLLRCPSTQSAGDAGFEHGGRDQALVLQQFR